MLLLYEAMENIGHFQEIKDFVKCIIKDKQLINTVERGRYVLVVEKAIIESARSSLRFYRWQIRR